MNVRIIEVYISLLSVVGKMYAGILGDGVCRVIGALIDDEEGGF